MTKRVFTYARVSTCNQQKGLEAQVRAIREYCARQSITNYVVFQDENQSGSKQSRPALDEMMKKIKAGECEKVIVYSFSRFARSVTHLLSALQEFEQLEVKFISISESINTETPIGRALFTILGSVAQLERDLIAERVRVGLHNAKMKGVKIGRKKTRPSQLIRTLRKSGMTYAAIAKVAGCSHGAIAAELREWAKEKAEGKEQIFENDIPPLSESAEINKSKTEKEGPPMPLETVRF